MNKYQQLINKLFELQDLKYREFTKKLTPTKYQIIGIRIPQLRKIAKKIYQDDYQLFLQDVQNNYFEEVFLQALVIANITEEKIFFEELEKLLPKIDNWAICDSFCNSIKIIKKNSNLYFSYFLNLLHSKKTFTIRVGLITILNNYIQEENLPFIFQTINKIKSENYYVNMGTAWLLCEIYIHFPLQAEQFLTNTTLNDFTINKTISKIRESYRISKETKKRILKYKRK